MNYGLFLTEAEKEKKTQDSAEIDIFVFSSLEFLNMCEFWQHNRSPISNRAYFHEAKTILLRTTSYNESLEIYISIILPSIFD